MAEFKIPIWTTMQNSKSQMFHRGRFRSPVFCFHCRRTKSQTNPLIFRTKFHDLLSDYPNYEKIFTDCSKDGDTAGSSCVASSDTYKCRLLHNASIFQRRSKLLIQLWTIFSIRGIQILSFFPILSPFIFASISS